MTNKSHQPSLFASSAPGREYCRRVVQNINIAPLFEQFDPQIVNALKEQLPEGNSRDHRFAQKTLNNLGALFERAEDYPPKEVQTHPETLCESQGVHLAVKAPDGYPPFDFRTLDDASLDLLVHYPERIRALVGALNNIGIPESNPDLQTLHASTTDYPKTVRNLAETALNKRVSVSPSR